MIVVKLMGGLGNQLFQYAYGRTLALRERTPLVLDKRWFRKGDREFGLGHYDIVARPFSWWRRSLVRCGFVSLHVGYWGGEKHFSDQTNLIRRELQPKVAVEGCESMRSCESVSLHVRRGDYFNHKTRAPIHGVNLDHYYKRAVALMQERLVNPHFFVFSDEPEWVKENLSLDVPMTVMEAGAPHEDLFRMSSCRHHIMANSTYSWWGAWLNPSEEKIITAPDKWFNGPGCDINEFLPKSWIKLSCSEEESESACQPPAAQLSAP